MILILKILIKKYFDPIFGMSGMSGMRLKECQKRVPEFAQKGSAGCTT